MSLCNLPGIITSHLINLKNFGREPTIGYIRSLNALEARHVYQLHSSTRICASGRPVGRQLKTATCAGAGGGAPKVYAGVPEQPTTQRCATLSFVSLS